MVRICEKLMKNIREWCSVIQLYSFEKVQVPVGYEKTALKYHKYSCIDDYSYMHNEENPYFNRVTGLEAIKLEGGAHALFDKLVPYVVFRKAFVHA